METVISDSNRNRNRYGASSVTLGPRDSLEGDLTVEGDLQIFGSVRGKLRVAGDLILEDGSSAQAEVQANNVSVRGALEGDVAAHGRLTIAGSGSVTGRVTVARLAVEDGAVFNGSITMHGSEDGNGEVDLNSMEDTLPVAVGESSDNHHND
jgi:cytoskeletal protein CcmA (bactofilin family)